MQPKRKRKHDAEPGDEVPRDATSASAASALDAVQGVPVAADLGPFISALADLVVADLLHHPARK